MGDAAMLTQLMNEEGVTMAAAVPTVWTLLLNHLRQTGQKLDDAETHLDRRFGRAVADDPRVPRAARRRP